MLKLNPIQCDKIWGYERWIASTHPVYSNRVLYVTLQPKRWNFPISRVVYRGYNNANANGGVVNANANNDAANANANVGSRLDKLITPSIGLPYQGRDS